MPGLTAEEISIRLNIDISDAEKMRRSLTETGKEAHKSFLHGDSAAKGLKKTLHELSDQVPVLGYALRAVISPIGAAFAAAAAGIGYATKALDEWNKKMDETAARNALPIGDRSNRPDSGIASFFRGRARSSALQQDVDDKRRQALGIEGGPLNILDRSIAANKEYLAAEATANNELFRAQKAAIEEKTRLLPSVIKDLEEKMKPYGNVQMPWYRQLASDLYSGTGLPEDPSKRGAVDAATQKKIQEGDKIYAELVRNRTALKNAINQLEVLNKVEEENNSILARKKKIWDDMFAVTSKIKDFGALDADVTTGKAVYNQLTMGEWKSPAGSSIDNNVIYLPKAVPDAITGGVTYNGLTQSAIDYKPIRGAIGWKPPVSNAASQQQSWDQLVRTVLEMAAAQMQADGLIVTGKG